MPQAPQKMLLTSSIPANLRLRDDVRVKLLGGSAGIESDMHRICERIALISPNLFIVQLEDSDARSWLIMEQTKHGSEELVYKTDELDARVLTKIRYMRSVPLEKRVAKIEAEIEAEKAAAHENEMEELYEKMGADFHKQLAHDGFITHTGKSFAKRGVVLNHNKPKVANA
ncbi:hypothetical protein [Sinimarinibacterium flocculans]|uniref:hypothetical protein n=1 Tax=Sinimarinibacterium flocculans TaxID=985250 RepID=UPI002490AF39|nr:hypothetical protein [Sinimarinibacterium flocculans]